MKTTSASTLVAALFAAAAEAAPASLDARDVDLRYPYTGPAVPIGDWVDQTVKGNGKGFPRLVEPPAVKPSSANPTNNINVVSLAYAGPNAMNIHFQTPFGLGTAPSVKWGYQAKKLSQTQTGVTDT